MKQYYYKDNSCPAKFSHEPECICWHDEGTGPQRDWKYVEDNANTCITWRDSDKIPYTLFLTLNSSREPIATIEDDGTVTIHKEGGDKDAARLLYDSIEVEGKTLRERIAELEDEIVGRQLSVDAMVRSLACCKSVEEVKQVIVMCGYNEDGTPYRVKQ